MLCEQAKTLTRGGYAECFRTHVHHDLLSDVDDTDEGPCLLLYWLIMSFVIFDTVVVIGDCLLRIPAAVLKRTVQ